MFVAYPKIAFLLYSSFPETIFLPIARLTLLNFFISSNSFVVKGSTTPVPGGPIPETPPA